MTDRKRRWMWSAMLLVAIVTIASHEAAGQEAPLAWDATAFFKYNIENIVLDKSTSPWQVTVIFSVSDPSKTPPALWDIKNDKPFTFKNPVAGAQPSPGLTIDIGWNTKDYVNTGSRFNLNPVVGPSSSGVGAALPIRVNALANSQPCLSPIDCPGVPDLALRFWVSSSLPPQMIGIVETGVGGTGVVAMEGHPVWPVDAPTEVVPVKSVFAYFPITDTDAVPRRQIVDFNTKCHVCHDGNHPGIPRLGMHGGSRNEEPGVCVICHNPNQTDIPYRTAASPPSTDPLGSNGVSTEVSVDFKRMVHEIHAGGFRRNPFKVVGFRGTVTDFSAVRFPAKLSNCLNCHIDVNGKGTFELPLNANVLGSTVQTGSVAGTSLSDVARLVDVDPSNNLRITPIASVCSSCHDGREIRSHMISKGAAFGILQSQIKPGQERCASCHGPGKEEDVRRAHDVPRSGSSGGDD